MLLYIRIYVNINVTAANGKETNHSKVKIVIDLATVHWPERNEGRSGAQTYIQLDI